MTLQNFRSWNCLKRRFRPVDAKAISRQPHLRLLNPSPWPHDPAKGWPHGPANWHSHEPVSGILPTRAPAGYRPDRSFRAASTARMSSSSSIPRVLTAARVVLRATERARLAASWKTATPAARKQASGSAERRRYPEAQGESVAPDGKDDQQRPARSERTASHGLPMESDRSDAVRHRAHEDHEAGGRLL